TPPMTTRHDNHESPKSTKKTKYPDQTFSLVSWVSCFRGFRRLAVLLIVCVIGSLGCGRKSTEEVETETVVPVTTAPAQMGSIRAVIHATGDVNPGPGAELIVTAPQPARIAEIT